MLQFGGHINCGLVALLKFWVNIGFSRSVSSMNEAINYQKEVNSYYAFRNAILCYVGSKIEASQLLISLSLLTVSILPLRAWKISGEKREWQNAREYLCKLEARFAKERKSYADLGKKVPTVLVRLSNVVIPQCHSNTPTTAGNCCCCLMYELDSLWSFSFFPILIFPFVLTLLKKSKIFFYLCACGLACSMHFPNIVERVLYSNGRKI